MNSSTFLQSVYLEDHKVQFFVITLVDANPEKGNNVAASNMVIHLGPEDKQQMRNKAYVTGSYSSGEISQGWSQPLPHH